MKYWIEKLILFGSPCIRIQEELPLSVKVLKTEIKAQQRSLELLRERNMATEEELEMMKELFKRYNIQYINDMIIARLELILKILNIMSN